MDWTAFWNTLAASLLPRLQQTSTKVGLTALAASLGIALTPESADLIVSVSVAVFGALLVALPPKK